MKCHYSVTVNGTPVARLEGWTALTAVDFARIGIHENGGVEDGTVIQILRRASGNEPVTLYRDYVVHRGVTRKTQP